MNVFNEVLFLSGLDMVNISCTHIICKDLTTAEVNLQLKTSSWLSAPSLIVLLNVNPHSLGILSSGEWKSNKRFLSRNSKNPKSCTNEKISKIGQIDGLGEAHCWHNVDTMLTQCRHNADNIKMKAMKATCGNAMADQNSPKVKNLTHWLTLQYGSKGLAHQKIFSQEWREGLRLLTNNNKINNVSPMQNLKKHWMRLRYNVY